MRNKSELIRDYQELFLKKLKSPFNVVQGDRKYEIKNKTNEIIIYEEIGFWGVTASMIKSDLKKIKGDISVRINSPGGDVFDGWAIYNLLKQYDRGIVTTIVDGEAASSASTIFLAGDKRKAAEPSLLMLHEAWAGILGNKREMREFADILDEIDSQILSIIQSISRKNDKETQQAFEKELWLGPQSAKEWGFVTEIITYNNDDTYNSRPTFDLSAFDNAPDELKKNIDGGMPTIRDLESALRDAGLTKNQAKAFIANGKVAIEEVDSEELWILATKLKQRLRR